MACSDSPTSCLASGDWNMTSILLHILGIIILIDSHFSEGEVNHQPDVLVHRIYTPYAGLEIVARIAMDIS